MSEKNTKSPFLIRPVGSPVFGPAPKAPKLSLPRRGSMSLTQYGDPAVNSSEVAAGKQHAWRHDGHVSGVGGAVSPQRQESAADRDAAVALQVLEQVLRDRERAVEERERKVGERERDLAEAEVLLRHHEALVRAAQKGAPAGGRLSAEERAAQLALKAELDRQEALLMEGREALREREKFIEESEVRLFAKVQEQQEKETELDQREEELRERSNASAQSVARTPEIKRAFDEFNE